MIFSPKELLNYKEFYFYSSKHSFIPRVPGQYFIYFIDTGHFYIGSSGNICKRIARHKLDLLENKHRNKKLQKIFNNATGPIYFYYKILSSKEESLKIEQEELNKFYCNGLCCNVTIIARNITKVKLTDLQKNKIGITSKLIWQKPGHREKVSLAIKQAHSNPEVIAKISQASKERWNDSKYRSLMIETANRNFKSDKHRQQASEITTRLWNDKEHRQMRINAMIAAQSAPETKAIKSQISKQSWNNPEHRAKRIESLKRVGSTPEFKAKMTEINRARFQDPEFKKKMQLARQGTFGKKVIINDTEYPSMSAAAKALNVNSKTLEYRIKTNTVHKCFK